MMNWKNIALGVFGTLALAFIAGSLICCPFGDGRLSKPKRVKMDISTLTSALQAHKLDAGVFPTIEQGLAALVCKPTIEPVPERWKATMKKVISDPWAREYQYRQPGVHNPDSFDLRSLGPDGIESGDDIGNWD